MFKNKSFADLFWSFSDNLSQQLINFIVGIILARLLLPGEFGLVGIVTVLISISSVLIDSGFSSALINKKNVKDIDYNTVFITNIAISSFLYLILYVSANWIAIFFDNKEITTLIRVAGINLILISLSSIHRTILLRNLNFKRITYISLISVSISAISAIFMAYNGFGVYSLVGRVLIGQFITVLLFWFFNKWRPYFKFSINSFKELFSYGINLLGANLLNSVHSNVYYIIIGKYFSPTELGYYTRATSFRDLASTNITNTIKRVSFSTLSKIDDQSLQFKKYNFYRDLTFLITSFLMLFIYFEAKEIILILLSDKWLPSIEILQILSITGLFLALYNLNLDFIAVLGNTKLYFRIELLSKLLVIPIVLTAIFLGFKLFLYTILIQNVLIYFVVTIQLNKLRSGIFNDQFKILIKFVLMFIPLFLIVYYNLIAVSNIYLAAILKASIVLFVFIVFNLNYIKKLKARKYGN